MPVEEMVRTIYLNNKKVTRQIAFPWRGGIFTCSIVFFGQEIFSLAVE